MDQGTEPALQLDVPAADSTAQHERQNLLAALKAKRAARSHGDEAESFDIESSRDSKQRVRGRKPTANSQMEQDSRYEEDADGNEASRTGRRARMEAMRAKCADRAQVARESSKPLSEIISASGMQDSQAESGEPSACQGTRTALQRKMDHIRLSRATRREELEQLQRRDECPTEVKVCPSVRERPRAKVREEPQQPLQRDEGCNAMEAFASQRDDLERLWHRAESPAEIKVAKEKPRPPAICTEFDDPLQKSKKDQRSALLDIAQHCTEQRDQIAKQQTAQAHLEPLRTKKDEEGSGLDALVTEPVADEYARDAAGVSPRTNALEALPSVGCIMTDASPANAKLVPENLPSLPMLSPVCQVQVAQEDAACSQLEDDKRKKIQALADAVQSMLDSAEAHREAVQAVTGHRSDGLHEVCEIEAPVTNIGNTKGVGEDIVPSYIGREAVKSIDQGQVPEKEIMVDLRACDAIDHAPNSQAPQPIDMYLPQQLHASPTATAVQASRAGCSLQQAFDLRSPDGRPAVPGRAVQLYSESHASQSVGAKMVSPPSAQKPASLDNSAEAMLENAVAQAGCSEGASDMNHISAVLSSRRATLQKLKEKRSARSQLVHMESNNIVIKDEAYCATIPKRDDCNGASQRHNLQSRRKLRHMQDEQEGLGEISKESKFVASVVTDHREGKVPSAETRQGTKNWNEKHPSVEMSYADFQQAQRYSTAPKGGVAEPPKQPRRPAAAKVPAAAETSAGTSDLLQRSKNPDLHTARMKRIRELQSDRGAGLMPEVSATKLSNLCSENGLGKSNGEPPLQEHCHVEDDDLCAQINSDDRIISATKKDCDDQIMTSKKVSVEGQPASRSGSVLEPEPEIEENEEESLYQEIVEPMDAYRRMVPLRLSEVQPSTEMAQALNVQGLQEEVQEKAQDMSSRFDAFCRSTEFEEDEPKMNPDDKIFEDLQGKWREMRGGMDKNDLRPEFRALLTPLDVRVDLGVYQERLPRAELMCPSTSSDWQQWEDGVFGQDLPKLTQHPAASPRKHFYSCQTNEVGMPSSPQKGKARVGVSLPALQLTDKVRPTLDRLPKSRQQETCVHQ